VATAALLLNWHCVQMECNCGRQGNAARDKRLIRGMDDTVMAAMNHKGGAGETSRQSG